MSPSAAMAAVLSPLHSKFSFSSSAAGGAKPSPTNSLSSDADTGTVVSLVAGDAGEGLDPSADLQAYVADAEKGVLSSAVAYRCWGDQWQAGWQCVCVCVCVCGVVWYVCGCSCGQAVIRKLGMMLNQPKALNLTITGIVAKLAQCPNPLLHAYLFPAASLRGETAPWPNVVSTLKSVRVRHAAETPPLPCAHQVPSRFGLVLSCREFDGLVSAGLKCGLPGEGALLYRQFEGAMWFVADARGLHSCGRSVSVELPGCPISL